MTFTHNTTNFGVLLLIVSINSILTLSLLIVSRLLIELLQLFT